MPHTLEEIESRLKGLESENARLKNAAAVAITRTMAERLQSNYYGKETSLD